MTWTKTTLSEVSDIQTGPFGSQLHASDYVNSGIPIIMPQDIVGNRVITDTIACIREEDAIRLAKYRVAPGDIIYSRRGDVERHALIGNAENMWLCGTGCLRVRPNKHKVIPQYLHYNLSSPDSRAWIRSHAHGTTMPNLNTTILGDTPICYPQIENQIKICGILELLDKKIDINNDLNDHLYEMVNAYYTHLFKNIECEMTTVGSYSKRVYSGGTPTTTNAAYWNGSFGWFSSGETRNRFVISTEKTITQAGVDNSSTKLAKKHDIVMASAGQGFTRGQASMLLLDTYVNQSVIVIHAERNMLPYLFWNLANRYEELRAISDSSSIRGSLTTKMISAFEIPHTDDASLQAFSDFAWSVIPKIENNLLENERLVAIRDSLLPKLMSGEIDVSEVTT